MGRARGAQLDLAAQRRGPMGLGGRLIGPSCAAAGSGGAGWGSGAGWLCWGGMGRRVMSKESITSICCDHDNQDINYSIQAVTVRFKRCEKYTDPTPESHQEFPKIVH
jgi:hypothetical protein